MLLIPIHVNGRVEGSLEFMRRNDVFDDAERRLARLAAGQATLAIRAFAGRAPDAEVDVEATLALAGEALAAGADELRTAEEITRFGGYRGIFTISGGRRLSNPFRWDGKIPAGINRPQNNQIAFYEMPIKMDVIRSP